MERIFEKNVAFQQRQAAGTGRPDIVAFCALSRGGLLNASPGKRPGRSISCPGTSAPAKEILLQVVS